MSITESGVIFFLVAGLAALLVGLSKGGLSMAGSLGTPVLAMVISPVKAAALLLPIFVVSDWFGLYAYRREFDARNLKILIPAGIAGIGIGWLSSALVSDRMVGLFIGLVGITFCLNAWRLRHHSLPPRPADIPRGLFWGTIAGFTSFISHSGGPPYQVYVLPQRLPKAVFAGTTTITFAAINLVKLLPYWQLGQLDLANLKMSFLLMPIAVAGTFAGVWLVRVIPQRTYFVLIHAALFALSIKLVVDAVR
ncbi:MAG TPA: sulfite exporter TauE/SafE family protein [Steroidobacteraceae bacterium]|nr:sulfite exporter TauE/SafE family protein [Steroidobacteraceae bacterium]